MVNEWNGRGFRICLERVPWLPLYRVRGQDAYKAGGSPDRRVESLREVLANLACKLRHLLVHVRSWLSSWSSGRVATGYGVVLLCRPWRHCSLDGGSSAVLCNAVSVVAFIIVSWFPGASYPK